LGQNQVHKNLKTKGGRKMTEEAKKMSRSKKINLFKLLWEDREIRNGVKIERVVISIALWTSRAAADEWFEKKNGRISCFKRVSRWGAYKQIRWNEVREEVVDLGIRQMLDKDRDFGKNKHLP